MKSLTLSLTTSLVLLSSLTAHADRKWNDSNNPANLESNYQYNFNRLPIKGTITDSDKGWSDSYWPATRGYISDRWQVPELAFKFKDYALVTPGQISYLSQDEINILSPAEKIDLIRGRYSFPLATKMREKNPSKSDWWRGVCNGWTQASLNIDEPQPIVYKSPISGLSVPLGSSDIKALLAYYYAYFDGALWEDTNDDNKHAGYIGKACKGMKKMFFDLGGACDDMNAGAFHVAVANELGLRHKGLAMDRDPSGQVWNQPFVGFESKILNITSAISKKHATKGTVKEVTVQTTMKYVNELYDTKVAELENDHHVAPQYEALGRGNQHYETVTYEYVLELDAYDQIIGGDWINGSSHPDFIWRQAYDPKGIETYTAKKPGYKYKDDYEDWSILADIVKQATAYTKIKILPSTTAPATTSIAPIKQ